MLGIIVLLFIILGLIPILFLSKKHMSSTKPQERTMLFAHDSTDTVAEAYYPAIRAVSMPFPIGKKKERRKTETFQRHSDEKR